METKYEGRYRHFRGKEYQIIAKAINSETLEELIVYQALYGVQTIWVRPLNMFFGLKTLPNGTEVQRFVKIEDETFQ